MLSHLTCFLIQSIYFETTMRYSGSLCNYQMKKSEHLIELLPRETSRQGIKILYHDVHVRRGIFYLFHNKSGYLVFRVQLKREY